MRTPLRTSTWRRISTLTRSNEDWLAALAAEDETALAELRSYLVRGLGAALRARGIAAELIVEDVVQDALLKVLSRLDSFEGRSGFKTWAMAVAVRGALTELRRKRWKDRSFDQLVADSAFEGIAATGEAGAPQRHAERTALLSALRRAISEDLTDRQRTAILAELQGAPQVEVARRLGTGRNALYKLTHDARRRLKAALERAGFDAADFRSVVALRGGS